MNPLFAQQQMLEQQLLKEWGQKFGIKLSIIH